ncbi:MAG: septum formation initiator family protein [Pseudomonadota bacterium]
MRSKFAAFGLTALILYFAFHAFAGETGLGTWSDLQTELVEKRATLSALEAEIVLKERDIARLTPGTVDPDFIEALARERLAYVYPGELILLHEDEFPIP